MPPGWWARNRWEHRSGQRNLAELKSDLEAFAYVAKEANLKLWEKLPLLLTRINAILSGTFAPDATAEPTAGVERPTDGENAAAVEEAIKRDDERLEEERERYRQREQNLAAQKRPRVGGKWIGDKPERALKLKPQLNDLVDASTRESVKAEWSEEAPLQIARLKMIAPMGDLFVASDGAIFGYKHGVARLMSYLGPEPERDVSEIQGFELPYSYSLSERGIFCDSNNTYLSQSRGDEAQLLTAVLRKAVNPLDEVKITTHGDLYSITESGPKKIARVVASDWFPGHLPG